MGFSADGIDIGIDVRANSGAQQLVDTLRTKIAGLREELAKASTTQTDVGASSTASINQAIGAFTRFGQLVDATNAKSVQGFRAEGDAIAAYLVKLGATDAELNKIGASIARVEQRAGAARIAPNPAPVDDATKKVQLFGSAADATFQRVPRGARTAANAFQTLALSVDGGAVSMRSAVTATGSLAFGLSQLSSNANVVASAAGIGAVITVLGIVIELLAKGSAETQKQDAALKAFTETNESFAARSKAASDVVSQLGSLPGSTAAQIKLIGITKEVDNLRAAMLAAQKDVANTIPTFNFFTKGLAQEGLTTLATREALTFAQELRTLQDELVKGSLTADQFKQRLDALGHANPQFAVQIAASRELAANYDALGESLRKLTAATLQARAEEKGTLLTFGVTPDLAKDLDVVNQKLAQLPKGALAVRAVEDEQKAVEKATNAWKQFVTTKAGDAFADLTFANAREQKNAHALSQLQTARAIVASERVVEGAQGLGDLAQRETEKAAQAVILRTQGDAAARRKAADDEFAEGKKQLARMSGLDSDRNSVAAALGKEHTEAILRINKEEADKVTALLAQLSDQRIQAEGKLSDDEFAVRRADAQRQFDADKKRITDAKLNADQEIQARIEAGRALTANLAAIEKDRTARLTEIDTEARRTIDELTGRTGDVDAAKIRAGFKKQLDVLAATINSAQTTDVEKALARQGQKDIEALIPLEVAKTRMGELAKIISAASTTGNAEVARATLLVNAHAITESTARQEILAALTAERDAIQATLPLLEAEAAKLPGNAEAQAQLEQYRTRLLELNIAIQQTGDQFFKLKETTRDAVTSSLATFFADATRLGTQSHTEINSFKAELASAQDELQGLLEKANRSPEDNQRITALRSEIQQTTVSLDNAKASLTSWRDLFLNAAESIINALVRVASQMLATALIERALSFLGGFGSAASSLAVAPADAASGGILAGTGVNGPGFATGGSVEGPSGIDKVGPSWLTRREFVQPVPAVDYYGEDLMRALQFRLIPRDRIRDAMESLRSVSVPRVMRRLSYYNEGGLVSPVEISRRGAAGEVHQVRIIAPPGFEVKHLDSPAGHQVVVKIISERANAVNAALGQR
jgi:hypothetical protein